jgi:hypothetical protein
MDDSLTLGTLTLIAKLFPVADKQQVNELLVTLCGNHLPLADTLGVDGIERVRFAVLKISQGSLDKLMAAVELANQDWRDILVGAGFGDDVL